ncbi:MAG: sulfate ABC transporter ATP-binding protein [Clostridiales bacterium]|nr:sulfate ABC transporter ATP-binding protein [Clostridiales bacterium]
MYIELKNINKTFGDYKASDNVNFGIEKGKLIALLGPSGSGKTTILRMIAGLEHQDDGDIYIDGKCVNDVPVKDREIGFVFQNYALFPYLNVFDNIAYGLKIRKADKDYIKKRVTELLELVGLPGLEKRYPAQLSGGQRQRVAFARALAPNPSVLLLDEPFAAIDAKVRKELRSWLKEMIEKIGITSIFVTHDQDEAVEVADEIIVTNLGRVEQMGTPTEIYKNPKTPFVAQFIGESTVLTDYDRLKGFEIYEGKRNAIVRPEFVKVVRYGTVKQYESLYAEGIVEQTAFRGNCLELLVNVNGIRLKALQSFEEEPFKKGEKVEVMVYRLYVVDENEAHLLQNEGLQEHDMFYI